MLWYWVRNIKYWYWCLNSLTRLRTEHWTECCVGRPLYNLRCYWLVIDMNSHLLQTNQILVPLNSTFFTDKLQLRKEVCSKKKRKSRTAFTNHQIFELEKRFLYQKYLSPADRDEISSTLGLSGGQVRMRHPSLLSVNTPVLSRCLVISSWATSP